MSTQPDDGGPAFPRTYGQGGGINGMTLRDWFAGQALPAVIAASQGVNNVTRDDCVAEAYLTADAMLEARTKGGGK